MNEHSSGLSAFMLELVRRRPRVGIDELVVEVMTASGAAAEREACGLALGRLLFLGFVEIAADGTIDVSDTGMDFLRTIGRVRGANLIRQIDLALEALPSSSARPFEISSERWVAARKRVGEEQRSEICARMEIVDGLVIALGHPDEVSAVVRGAVDRAGALQALMGSPLAFTEIQAQHVLDMTVARQTRGAVEALRVERTHLSAALADLDEAG